jgi:hypothetical protein
MSNEPQHITVMIAIDATGPGTMPQLEDYKGQSFTFIIQRTAIQTMDIKFTVPELETSGATPAVLKWHFLPLKGTTSRALAG